MKNLRKLMIAVFALMVFAILFTACGGSEPEPVTPRAVYELGRMLVDGQEVNTAPFNVDGSRLTFIGEEAGGNVIIRVGETDIHASINPNRNHPSFADGYWHHHLYAGATTPGSPRINFMVLLPHLGIDDNGADDNTQSAYQRGNLHYIVETGEFRLRFTINGIVHDLIFVQS